MQAKMKEMFQNSDPETRRMMEQTFKQAQSMKNGKFDPLTAMAGMGMPGMGMMGDIFGGHGDHSHGPNCSHQH
jgi:flagellar motor component MotA